MYGGHGGFWVMMSGSLSWNLQLGPGTAPKAGDTPLIGRFYTGRGGGVIWYAWATRRYMVLFERDVIFYYILEAKENK